MVDSGLRGPRRMGAEGGRASGQRHTRASSKLAEPEERARYARVFDRGLNVPTASCCRCSAGTRRPPNARGSASAGRCAVARCSSSREIPRWAAGSRWPRCPMSRRPPIPSSSTETDRAARAPAQSDYGPNGDIQKTLDWDSKDRIETLVPEASKP